MSLELTLWERLLKVFAKMVLVLLEVFNVEMEDVMDKLMQDKRISHKLLVILSALDGSPNNQENIHDLDITAA